MPPETVPSRSFRETLLQEGLRLATYVEERGRLYVLECGVCGEAHCFNNGMSITSQCWNCGTKWQDNPPRFWALLLKSVTPPEDE